MHTYIHPPARSLALLRTRMQAPAGATGAAVAANAQVFSTSPLTHTHAHIDTQERCLIA